MTDSVISEGFFNPDVVVGEFGVVQDMKVADFGCGAGHIGILVAQKIGKGGVLFALDIMEDKLDSIRAQAKANGLENVQTKRANLEVMGSTSLADMSQDMVLLINILFQSTKKEEILKEANRVLKIGGKIVFIEWKKGAARQGFGPPEELRTDSLIAQEMFLLQGFKLERQFNAGQFHYGLIFKK
ncbi:MAG: methyltransferase domain-containing protein [Patescibacteria group bacterium]